MIVTFNSAQVVLDCLGTVAGIADAEVIVYDNASSDDTVDVIRLKFPTVRIIEGPRNEGFAVGVNRAAAESSSPLIMLLNPDAVIEEESVRALTTSAASGPLRVVAPLVTHPQQLVKVASAGYFPTPLAMMAHYSGLSRLPGVRGHYLLLRDARAEQLTKVDWVSGACLMTSRTTWAAVGGLDERWFMYAEDIDFCWRVSRLGGEIFMDSAATAHHLVGQSSGELSTDVNSMWVENLHDFYSLRMSPNWMSTAWWAAVVSVGLLLRSLIFSAQRRPKSAHEFRAHSKAVLGRGVSMIRHRRSPAEPT